MSIIIAKQTDKGWIGISRTVQEANFIRFKKEQNKNHRQMLWKCGRKKWWRI